MVNLQFTSLHIYSIHKYSAIGHISAFEKWTKFFFGPNRSVLALSMRFRHFIYNCQVVYYTYLYFYHKCLNQLKYSGLFIRVACMTFIFCKQSLWFLLYTLAYETIKCLEITHRQWYLVDIGLLSYWSQQQKLVACKPSIKS